MSYTINNSLTAAKHGGTRSASAIKYIVLHYTANSGTTATAKGNANYFHTTAVSASAHYCVDENETVYQCLPDTVIGWSVGGSKLSTGGGSLYKVCTNANSISIEMVSHSNSAGYYIPDATISRAAELTKALMKKYNIDEDHVIRHYDVTGKLCPEPMCKTAKGESAWKSFKALLTASSTSSTATSKPAVANPTVKNGSRGTEAKNLQLDLNYLGASLTVDGIFGAKSVAALKAWQTKYLGASEADGIYGKKGYAKMKTLI